MSWIEIIVLIIVVIILLAVILWPRPLPPWVGLTGEKYLKWKKGEKGKSDMSD